jgi:GntR family transcriptional regulator/MocR family aminotransferase
MRVQRRYQFRTRRQEVAEFFRGLARSRVVIEVGTHSAWVREVIAGLGHEVLVANARRMAGSKRRRRKNDRIDAARLARLGRVDPQSLYPIQHRSTEVREDLLLLRAREALVESRTKLISAVRGLVKTMGGRLSSCSSNAFSKKVAAEIPDELRKTLQAQKPLHKQIYDAYRLAIVNGHLRPGQRVPSTRVLSSELGVSRFPVLDAYSQLLAEGYFESSVGAGTVVCSSLPERFTLSAPNNTRSAPSKSESRTVARRASTIARAENVPWGRDFGAFGLGQVASDQFPHRIWSKLVARHCRKMDAESSHYGDPMGLLALRETIASYLRTARSVRCEAERIMILSGSQQALVITAQVPLDWEVLYGLKSRVTVWLEMHSLSINAMSCLSVDNEGLNVAAGILKFRKARAAIVTPSHQFPLGVTMSPQRRLQLLDWAQNMGAWIIEDDYDSEYRYESSPIASLQGLDVNARVVYVGTFSKVLFPSLRLGYVSSP